MLYVYFLDYVSQGFEQPAFATPKPAAYGFNPQQQTPFTTAATPQVPPIGNVFGQPIVQDMAFQYGQQLAATGKTVIKQEVEKYVPVSKLKYYFAVDTRYVLTKLRLLLFPFTHTVS